MIEKLNNIINNITDTINNIIEIKDMLIYAWINHVWPYYMNHMMNIKGFVFICSLIIMFKYMGDYIERNNAYNSKFKYHTFFWAFLTPCYICASHFIIMLGCNTIRTPMFHLYYIGTFIFYLSWGLWVYYTPIWTVKFVKDESDSFISHPTVDELSKKKIEKIKKEMNLKKKKKINNLINVIIYILFIFFLLYYFLFVLIAALCYL